MCIRTHEAVLTRNYDADVLNVHFRMMLDEAQEWAERSGLRESDVAEAVKSVRRRKRL